MKRLDGPGGICGGTKFLGRSGRCSDIACIASFPTRSDGPRCLACRHSTRGARLAFQIIRAAEAIAKAKNGRDREHLRQGQYDLSSIGEHGANDLFDDEDISGLLLHSTQWTDTERRVVPFLSLGFF